MPEIAPAAAARSVACWLARFMPPEPRKSKIPAIMKSIPSTKAASTGEKRLFECSSAKLTVYVTPARMAEEPSREAMLRKTLLFMVSKIG